MITVSEIMSTDLVTMKPYDKISDAEELMKKEHIRHIPIVDDNLYPVGILSQRDVLRAQGQCNADEGVEQIMSKQVAFVTPSDSLRSAGILVQKHKFGCMPVMDDNQLVGIITDSDFVAVAIDLIEQLDIQEEF